MSAIACICLTAFPLWVRRQLASDDRPIIVHEEGRVIAASRELRSRGLRFGESPERARLLLPEAVLHQRDRLVEEAMWEDLLYLLHELSPRLLSLRPGCALLEPSDRERLRRLTRVLQARTAITARRITSMLAALGGASGETLELTPAGARKMLDDSSVHLLAELGFGTAMIEELVRFGMETLGPVWKLTSVHLERRFGPEGERLFRLLHPEGEEQQVPEFHPPAAVVVACDCDYPVADPAELLPALDHLVHRGIGELAGRRTQLLTLRLYGGYCASRVSRRVLKGPLSRPYPIYVAAEAMLRAMTTERVPVERLTLELGGLSHPDEMFLGPLQERPMVYETVRPLHQRFPGLLM
jgi:nucleotidyltransferase/DNA polymerase involved in DNA repair